MAVPAFLGSLRLRRALIEQWAFAVGRPRADGTERNPPRRERQLTALGRGFTIGDFDISPDGRELLFDRSRDESDIVLIERPK